MPTYATQNVLLTQAVLKALVGKGIVITAFVYPSIVIFKTNVVLNRKTIEEALRSVYGALGILYSKFFTFIEVNVGENAEVNRPSELRQELKDQAGGFQH